MPSAAILVPALLACLVAGCTTRLGPQAIRFERPEYNQQIVRSADEQMLLNIVRLRYNDSPLFLELSSVVAQYGYDPSVSGSRLFRHPPDHDEMTLGTALGYYEHPTVTYLPLSGEEFATRLLTPIPLDCLMLFAQTGWSVERLLLIAVQRVNDVYNAPTATGPTPERAPEFQAFADLAERFRRLQLAGLIGLNWELRDRDAGPPDRSAPGPGRPAPSRVAPPSKPEGPPEGRIPHFWLRMPVDTKNPLADDVVAIRRSLDLVPGEEDFLLTAYPFRRQPTEIGMRCRSLLGVLYFLSQSVEPPAPHAQAGLLRVTQDENGKPFDWTKVTGRIIAIHSQRTRPANAAVAVQHRGWWFYIADNDFDSKATFSMVNILFSLQSASAKGKSPLLTLPVGK